MKGSVVTDIISELPNGNYNLFFDNLFTSLPLMKYLSEKNFGGTGTIHQNRTEKAPSGTTSGTNQHEKDTQGKLCANNRLRCWYYFG